MYSNPAQTLLLPAHPHPIPIDQARRTLPPAEFRRQLRQAMFETPAVTLSHVAQTLGVTRQYVGALVGKLNRPNCAHPGPRPAPKRDAARRALAELKRRVVADEPTEKVAKDLGVSLAAAAKLGFRVHAIRPAHGKGRMGCNCWRCRRASGTALSRGRRANSSQRAEALDWLAYRDPDTDEALTQAVVGELSGVGQPTVSRLARAREVS